ncbi:uncharacterized protein LOC122017392 [Zingiber officinale]|uniref:uncharacterized protein LOC122017392 n=1 Tax=Zingiber officinale TaxID=94328 RepID=UPI001C4AB84C|nr:uncharacterized protein LOC122017392 [Zingiber officinale]
MLLPSPSSSAERRQRSNFLVMAAAKICFQRPLDSLRRKLKKPLFKGDARVRRGGGAGWWWRSALLFWKQSHQGSRESSVRWRSRTAQLWPVYTTESSSGTRRPRAAMLLAAAEVGAAAAAGVAYQRLRDAGGDHRAAAAAPIYIVT